MSVVNTSGSKNLPFQFALHNYLRLPEGVLPTDVSVDKVLKGLEYKNLMEGMVMETEDRDTFVFQKQGTGRLYSPLKDGFSAKLGESGQSFKFDYEGEKLRELNLLCYTPYFRSM
jgi:glucose-6-phosphate 1-epimerase